MVFAVLLAVVETLPVDVAKGLFVLLASTLTPTPSTVVAAGGGGGVGVGDGPDPLVTPGKRLYR